MSIETAPAASATALDATSGAATRRDILHRLLMTIGPILAALVIAGCILLAVGVDPLAYYGYVLEKGLFSPLGIQQTLTRMAPLLFLAAGLIVAFR
ncbi:ABC transporter permease, partial [bacterium M00.F.Ca.ET.222.01.1.1]